MGEFFKKMVRGIFFILLSPIAAIILAFYLTYGLLLFVFMSLKSIPVFLKGGSILEPTAFDVDVEKKLISEKREEAARLPEHAGQKGTTINVFIPEGYINPNEQKDIIQKALPTHTEVKEIDLIEGGKDD